MPWQLTRTPYTRPICARSTNGVYRRAAGDRVVFVWNTCLGRRSNDTVAAVWMPCLLLPAVDLQNSSFVLMFQEICMFLVKVRKFRFQSVVFCLPSTTSIPKYENAQVVSNLARKNIILSRVEFVLGQTFDWPQFRDYIYIKHFPLHKHQSVFVRCDLSWCNQQCNP